MKQEGERSGEERGEGTRGSDVAEVKKQKEKSLTPVDPMTGTPTRRHEESGEKESAAHEKEDVCDSKEKGRERGRREMRGERRH